MLAAFLWLVGAEQALAAAPSFPCVGRLTRTETLICGDAELSAYDRAMALAYAHELRPTDWSLAKQRDWIAKRNRCAVDRACVLDAYRGWIASLDPFGDDNLPKLTRKDTPPNGDDLMLGMLQSPTGRVTPTGDIADLIMQPVGGGWYLFVVTSQHFYDPHDGRGANFSDAEQVGVVRLANGKARWRDADAYNPEPCSIDFTRLPKGGWMLQENGTCGGIGAMVDGVYR